MPASKKDTDATVLVQHPVVESLVYRVPADKEKDWTEAGWKPAKDDGKIQAPVQVSQDPTA